MQCFEFSCIILRIRILVRTNPHWDPKPGPGVEKVPVPICKTIFHNKMFSIIFFFNFYIISLSAKSSHHEPQVLFMFVCLLDPNPPSGSGSIRSPTVRIRIRNTGVHVHTELPKLGPKWAGAGQVQVTGQLQDGDTQREHITGLTHTRGHVVSSVVDPNRLYLDPDPSVSDPDPDSWVFCIRIRNPDPGTKKKFKMLNHHNII